MDTGRSGRCSTQIGIGRLLAEVGEDGHASCCEDAGGGEREIEDQNGGEGGYGCDVVGAESPRGKGKGPPSMKEKKDSTQEDDIFTHTGDNGNKGETGTRREGPRQRQTELGTGGGSPRSL